MRENEGMFEKNTQAFPVRCRFLFQSETLFFPSLSKTLRISKLLQAMAKRPIIYQTSFLDLPVITGLLRWIKPLKTLCPHLMSITISEDKTKFYFAALKKKKLLNCNYIHLGVCFFRSLRVFQAITEEINTAQVKELSSHKRHKPLGKEKPKTT